PRRSGRDRRPRGAEPPAVAYLPLAAVRRGVSRGGRPEDHVPRGERARVLPLRPGLPRGRLGARLCDGRTLRLLSRLRRAGPPPPPAPPLARAAGRGPGGPADRPCRPKGPRPP